MAESLSRRWFCRGDGGRAVDMRRADCRAADKGKPDESNAMAGRSAVAVPGTGFGAAEGVGSADSNGSPAGSPAGSTETAGDRSTAGTGAADSGMEDGCAGDDSAADALAAGAAAGALGTDNANMHVDDAYVACHDDYADQVFRREKQEGALGRWTHAAVDLACHHHLSCLE